MKTKLLKQLRKEAHKKYGMVLKYTDNGLRFAVGIRWHDYDVMAIDLYEHFGSAFDALDERRRKHILKEVFEKKNAELYDFLWEL